MDLADIETRLRDPNLSSFETDRLRHLAADLAASRHRGSSVGSETDRFLSETLDIVPTPYGVLTNKSYWRDLYHAAAAAITHAPPGKKRMAWRDVRDVLWVVKERHKEKTPEHYIASAIWERLQALETSLTQ